MNHFSLTVENKTYEIEILNDPRADEVQVRVDGTDFAVSTKDLTVESVIAAPQIKAAVTVAAPVAVPVASEPVGSVANTVRAPLPGKINAIKVSTGQSVKVNDPLVVIEAMKAMNIIRAQKNGKVGKIYVTVGSTIAHGAAMLDIE